MSELAWAIFGPRMYINSNVADNTANMIKNMHVENIIKSKDPVRIKKLESARNKNNLFFYIMVLVIIGLCIYFMVNNMSTGVTADGKQVENGLGFSVFMGTFIGIFLSVPFYFVNNLLFTWRVSYI